MSQARQTLQWLLSSGASCWQIWHIGVGLIRLVKTYTVKLHRRLEGWSLNLNSFNNLLLVFGVGSFDKFQAMLFLWPFLGVRGLVFSPSMISDR